MKPYRITQAKLITYSGKMIPIDVGNNILTEPIRKVKDKILDAFINKCKESSDPYVKIEVRTVPLFEE